ncbi:MAG: hypothetical protein RLZZ480_838 [Candidatus Parcubacteria bacterium]|jgi:hypothetical protein
MYKNTLLILAGILVMCGAITGYVVWSNSGEGAVVEQEILITPVTYTAKETGKWVDIRFYESTAVLNGIGFSWLEFQKVTGDTEGRYENNEENLVLKLEGETVTLVRGRQTLFVGTSAETEVSIPEIVVPLATTSTSSVESEVIEQARETATTTSDI